MLRTRVALAALTTLTTLGVLGAPSVAGVAPNDVIARALVLDPGDVAAQLAIELNLQDGRFAMPMSIAPDLWVGVTSRLTIGLVHSNESIEQIDARASFCFRSNALSCDRTYRGSGLDVRWSWREGALAIAPRGRVLVRDTDPWKPAVTAGALVRWAQGRYAITSDPYLRLGLANRDLGNRAAVVLPVSFGIQPTLGWLVALHTGWDGELATWRDGWHIPLALAATVRATSRIDLGISAGFPHLLGPQNTPKERAMSITLEVRP